MLKTSSLLIALAVLVVGCSPAPEAKDQKVSVQTSEETNAGDSKVETPAAPVASLPSELKGDAYAYYGLENSEPIKMEIRSGAGPSRSGMQTIKLKEVKDGAAIFTVDRTDGLADLGSMELSLDKKGLFVLSTNIGKVEENHLELPNDLKLGKVWNVKSKITRDTGQSVENDATFKVQRMEKVTTPVGSYDALLITSSGPANVSGNKMSMTTKGWFVKGRGPVKMEIDIQQTGQPANKMTIIEVKP
jgi:hypothetical protein